MKNRHNIDEAVLAEMKLANDLKAREVEELKRIADRPNQRNFLETISHWWNPDKSSSMRMRH